MAAGFSGTGKIWMNGKIVDWKDANIHIASHVIHYGSAVFEGARCYDTPKGSVFFRLDAHMRRLYDSARIYRMDYGLDCDAFTQAVIDTVVANGLDACYIRPLIYRGYHALGVNPLPCPVEGAILVWEWGAYLGQDALEKGVDVRAAQRGVRPESVHHPGQRRPYAAAFRIGTGGHHARHDHHAGAGRRADGQGNGHAARDALHGRRDLLRRHRG
jgi:branched-subunit amino acid aminotransferase/4-amino-4-deoxychorismate lyase